MIELLKDRSKSLGRNKQGKEIFIAELRCDTCSELIDLTEINNVILHFGSLAHAVREGEICSLDSDGTWHKQSDGSAVTAEENVSSSAGTNSISLTPNLDISSEKLIGDTAGLTVMPAEPVAGEIQSDTLTEETAEGEPLETFNEPETEVQTDDFFAGRSESE